MEPNRGWSVRRRGYGSFAAFIVFLVGVAGQPEGAGAAPPVVPQEVEAAAKIYRAQGKAHFDKGEYKEALDAFEKALALRRNAGAVAQKASCLNQLGRYDEALAEYESFLREFPDAKAATRAQVNDEMKALLAKVGTIAVAGDALAGAMLFVDQRQIGVLPLPAPVRVAAGIHVVRAEKPGFPPIAAKVEVKAGEPSVATLVAEARQGRLEVREKHNWVLTVELDGKDVGLTPWSGFVGVGDHRVRLRGYMGVDALLSCDAPEDAAEAGAKMESAEHSVAVSLYEVTQAVLGAEDVDASLRVDSRPAGAALRIDGRAMGKTPWEGRLPLGERSIEVSMPGFVTAKEEVRLEKRKQREVTVALERLPDLTAIQAARTLRNVSVGVAYGVGALGLGLFAVTGGMASAKVSELRERCGGGTMCPKTEQPSIDSAATLGTASTVGLVVGGIGAATGTVLFFALRPEDRARPKDKAKDVAWTVGAGPGGLHVLGRFE